MEAAVTGATQRRRSRMRRTRTGKPLALTPRDLEIFRWLSRYRYLRSTYLHAFAGGASATRFKERLGDLFHEGYLDRPARQWEFADARCAPAVYELGERARRALAERGAEFEPRTFLSSGLHAQFLHATMICECLASIELAARSLGDLRFIPWAEIAAKLPPETVRSPLPFKLPLASGAIIPDALFGLEYLAGGRKAYRFFALEADRGTMPVSRNKEGQTSYLAKLALYHEVIDRQLHRSHWGVPNLFVLTLTTDENRLADILFKLGGEHPLLLIKAMPPRALADPAPELLTEPWQRPGLAPFSIDR
jgi:Replication-relaxation